MTDPTLECKPTPHPDAVDSGTCPSPSANGFLDDVLGGDPTADGDGQPTAKDEPVSQAPTEPQTTTAATSEPDLAAELPVTGFPATAGAGVGFVLMLAGIIVLMWMRRRRLGA